MNKHFDNITYLALLLLFIGHLFFIQADADYNLSWSRGPWTDEGLHACQVRNFIQQNDTSVDKSDNLLKTPIFGAILFSSYQVFGISLTVSRLTVLCLALLALLIIAKHNQYLNTFILLSIPITFLQYFVFHYSHLSMSEILCSLSVLLGIFFCYKALLTEKKSHANTIASAFFLFLAYTLKIQFVYVVFIVPAYLSLLILSHFLKTKKWNVATLKLLIIHSLVSFVLGLGYAFLWYFPHKELFDHIFADQVDNKFVEWNVFFELLEIYYDEIFMSDELQLFTYVFLLSIPIGLSLLFHSKTSHDFKLLFALIGIWLTIELHKLTITYLPSRYLVSFYIAMGLLIALVFRELLYRFKSYTLPFKTLTFLFTFLILLISTTHLILYKETYLRRSYDIAKLNEKIAQISNPELRPIVGPWAPSLSWGSQALSFPVWYNFFNDKDLLQKYRPKIIISELDEEDSGYAYKNQNIALDSLAKTILYDKVAKWEIKILVLE